MADGLAEISEGAAKVAGYDLLTESFEVRQRVGYLPESVPLYTEMRVREYLVYRAKLKGVERHARASDSSADVAQSISVPPTSQRMVVTATIGSGMIMPETCAQKEARPRLAIGVLYVNAGSDLLSR